MVEVRSCIGILGLHDFFHRQIEILAVFNIQVEASSELTTNVKALKSNTDIWWIERYHSISDFYELMMPVLSSWVCIAD